jgi:hypothetical protein
MSGLQTEYEFFLPKGYVDDDGVLHRDGTMRLATARDELEPLRDPRVRDADDPFLTIIVLSRVVSRLGSLSQVTTREVERLFAADLAYLQDVYGAINFGTPDDVADVIEDAELRRRESRKTATPRRAVVIDDSADDADDDTIDADELAATLQARFGDDADPDDRNDAEDALIVAGPRRGRIEEVGSRRQ